MIIIFEQDTRRKEEMKGTSLPFWKFAFFTNPWKVGEKEYNYRFCFGIWSISFYHDRSLRNFMEHTKANSCWLPEQKK